MSIGIIGYGDFGKLIETITNQYYPDVQVKIFSRKKVIDSIQFFSLEEVCQTDVLFITVPIKYFELQITQIVPLLSKDTIVVDVCTVKVHPANIMKRHRDQVTYICTHPMFGPYSYQKIGNKVDDLRIVLTDHNLDSQKHQKIKEILQSMKFKILEMTVEEHDKKLAETLFLTHLVGQVVHFAGFERTDIDTISFGFLMDAVESVRQDIDLFHDVFVYNPYCKKVLQIFKNTTKHIEDILDD